TFQVRQVRQLERAGRDAQLLEPRALQRRQVLHASIVHMERGERHALECVQTSYLRALQVQPENAAAIQSKVTTESLPCIFDPRLTQPQEFLASQGRGRGNLPQ